LAAADASRLASVKAVLATFDARLADAAKALEVELAAFT